MVRFVEAIKALLLKSRNCLFTERGACPAITMEFPENISVALSCYRMCDLKMTYLPPNLQSWVVYGEINSEWEKLDKYSTICSLDDGTSHDFSIPKAFFYPMSAIRLCMTGRNRRCFRQMHLTEFTLFGDVLGSRID
jgi:hypothetical protein